MPPQNESRAKPLDVKIHVSTGAGVDVAWADGHRSHYEFSYLRDRCPCAVCNEEHGHGPAPAAANPLQLYTPRPGVRAASAVGHYAVQFDFNDGHSTGIYSFDYLRQICPCEACRRADSPSV